MVVTMYKFTKKVNSTKIPPTTAPYKTFTSVILKKDCSVMNPILIIQIEPSENIHYYNYCGMLGRYYFIKDWVSINTNIWEAHMECDVLASYKTEILQQNCYILRSAAHPNAHIPDGKFPVSGEVVTARSYPVTLTSATTPAFPPNNTPWEFTFSTGTYIVGIINSDAMAGGALSYYAMTPAQFAYFKSIFLGGTSWIIGNFQNLEISEDLWKSLFNPFQYIANCRWYPISSIPGTAATTIKIGWWDLTNCPCTKLSTLTYDLDGFRFFRPDNPAVTYDYQFLPPYATYRLYIPPFGEYELDGYKVGCNYEGGTQGISNLIARIRVDFVSGIAALLVAYDPNGYPTANEPHSVLISDTAKIAVDVSFGQVNTDVMGQALAVGKTVTGIVGTFLGNPTALAGAASGIIDGINAAVPQSQYRDGSGTISVYQNLPFMLQATYKLIVEADIEDYGGLFYEKDTISNHPGFVMTFDVHPQIDGALKIEIDKIKSLMDGGFFNE